MLKILPNTRQKRLPHTHVHGQRHGKRIRLRMLRRAVKGHALKVNTTLTYKLKNSPTYKFKSNSPTQQKSRTHQFEPISSNIKTPKSSLTYKLKLINLKTHQLTSSNSPTQILTNLKTQTHQLTRSETHKFKLKNSLTYKLKLKNSETQKLINL